MAYESNRYQVRMVTATGTIGTDQVNLSAATRSLRAVFDHDVMVRAIAVTSVVTKGSGGALAFRIASAAGGAAATGTQFSLITLASGNNQGEPYIRQSLLTRVSAGSAVHAVCTTAATGQIVTATLYVEQKPSDPRNKTQVHLVTT
jgi:hypothetical protein